MNLSVQWDDYIKSVALKLAKNSSGKSEKTDKKTTYRQNKQKCICKIVQNDQTEILVTEKM